MRGEIFTEESPIFYHETLLFTYHVAGEFAMGTYYFSRFADVEQLRQFNFPLLYQFLSPYRDYLCGKHDLRWTDHPDTFPYRPLVGILALPDQEMPDMLCSGLFFIDALSTPEGTTRLVEALHQNGRFPAFPLNYRDCALYAWLTDPGLLQWVHTHLVATKNKITEQFFSKRPCYPDDSKERLIAWENDLNAWLAPGKRHGIQVMSYRRNQAIEFHLRHGEWERQGAPIPSKSMTRRSVPRPQRIDFLLCFPQECRLEIRSETTENNRAHCFLFGKHCFNNPTYFDSGNPKGRYTLEPLRERGRNALICRDIDGLNQVCLRELHVEQEAPKRKHQIVCAKECLFEDYETLNCVVDPESSLVQASFLIYGRGSKKPQVLNIHTPNLLHFQRGTGFDEEILLWVKKRAFAQF